MSKIPEPTNTGSYGTQEETETTLVVTVENESPLQGLSLATTFEGLAETSERSLGGKVGANLIAAVFREQKDSSNEMKQEFKDTCVKLEDTQKDLSKCKTETAVLQERVSSLLLGRHLRNFGIFAGTILIGSTIELYRNSFEGLAVAAGIMGTLFIVLSWFFWEAKTK